MPAPTVTIAVDSPRWEQKATQAIDKRRRVKLIFRGPQALAVGEALRRRQPASVSRVVGVDDVAITAAIVIAVIAALGLAVLATVCLYAIHEGYTVGATHRTRGPMPFDDELILDLKPGK